MLAKLLTKLNIHLWSNWFQTVEVNSNGKHFRIENRVCFICGKLEERMK